MGRSRSQTIEIDRTDVGSLLGKLARSLRNDGLALTGLGHQLWSSGGQESEDLGTLAGSLEQAAAILKGVSTHLCSACKLKNVSERVIFGNIQIRVPEMRGTRSRRGR